MKNEYVITPDGGFVSKDELRHWGIPGMKWGIRRYQNKDGSLTPAGEKRYAKLEAEMNTLKGSKKTTDTAGESTSKKSDIRKKVASEMTDDELRERTARMQLEANYHNAEKNLAAANPVKVSAGKKFMNSLINDVVAPAAKSAGKEWLEKTMKDKLGLNKKDIDPVKKLEEEYKTFDWEQKIKKLKDKDPDNELSWDERNKKQQYEWNEYLHERERQKNDKADADARKAEKAAKQADKHSSNSSSSNNSSNNKPNNNSSSNTDSSSSKSSNNNPTSTNSSKTDNTKSSTKEPTYTTRADDYLNSKYYKKEVDRILAEMDKQGWEMYEREKKSHYYG